MKYQKCKENFLHFFSSIYKIVNDKHHKLLSQSRGRTHMAEGQGQGQQDVVNIECGICVFQIFQSIKRAEICTNIGYSVSDFLQSSKLINKTIIKINYK
jgi:hypothetical protein